jgi:hypothetical protein
MSKPNWDIAIELAEQMFGEKCWELTANDSVLLVKHEGTMLFLLQKKEENDFFSMHLRAGLLPNTAAYIASSFFVNMDFVLGENFEFVDSKTMAFGKDALQFAADNIHSLWDLGKTKTGMKSKCDVDTKKVIRPKDTLLN